MATPLPTGSRKRPSKLAIAFAVSIVLSKPEELSVKDYIQLLRQHVAKGRRENAISSAYRHLDRSSYWRSEYERIKDVLRAIEGETVDLKQEVDILKAKLENAKPTSPAKKRKKPDEDVVPVPRSPKKAKRDTVSAKAGTDVTEFPQSFDIVSVGEVGNILMRSLYQTQAVVKSYHKTEASSLAHHLIRAASALPQVIQRAVQHHTSAGNADNDSLKDVLTGAGRSISILMTGLNRLSHDPEGVEVQGQVTYAYVQMYQKLLEALMQASNAEAKKDAESIPSATTQRKQSPAKAKAKQPKALNLRDSPALNVLATFLCSVITNLDSTIESHKALFEGLAYAVLEQLGPKLYLLVFNHPRPQTVEEEIAVIGQPDEIEDSAESQPLKPEELEVKAAKRAAPYLVRLLSELMNAAPAHLGAIISRRTGKAKQANNKGSMKGALAIAAKERLQRTLVNCMFGTEGVNDEDPFKDCLKMPIRSGAALPMPKVKEVDVQDWFKEEVWRLLGWEILSSEADW